MNSASDTTKLVGGLSEVRTFRWPCYAKSGTDTARQIPWDSLEVPLEQKKEDFFNLVVELTGICLRGHYAMPGTDLRYGAAAASLRLT